MSAEPIVQKKSKPARLPAADFLNAALAIGLAVAPFAGHAKDIHAWWTGRDRESVVGGPAQPSDASLASGGRASKQDASTSEEPIRAPEREAAVPERDHKGGQPPSGDVQPAATDVPNGRSLRNGKGSAAVDERRDVNVPPIVRQRPKEMVATTAADQPAKTDAKQEKAKAK